MEWISHRGYSESKTENSMEAFEEASLLGFRHLETDLRVTKDLKIVLHHDENLIRTANLDKKIEELNSLDFSKLRYTKVGSPTFLSDLLDQFPDYKYIFDIKPNTGIKTIAALTSLAKHRNISLENRDQFRFLFWNKAQLDTFKLTHLKANTLPLESHCKRAGVGSILGLGAFCKGLSPNTYALPPRFYGIDLYKENTVKYYRKHLDSDCLAYLPEEPEDILQAHKVGFKQILTNGKILKFE